MVFNIHIKTKILTICMQCQIEIFVFIFDTFAKYVNLQYKRNAILEHMYNKIHCLSYNIEI